MIRKFIITGTTRGLGKELVKVILKESDHEVVSLSRRLIPEFRDVADLHHFNVDLSDGDLSSLFPDLAAHLKGDHVVFINNAAVIEPIKKIGEFTDAEISRHVQINMLTPMLLINKMTPYLENRRVTILNITSGVVNNQIAGWSLYCSTKSAMNAYFNTLAKEHPDWEIRNADPGVMDTGMQKEIRSGDFKEKERFEAFKSEGKLHSPETVAKSILSDYP